MTITAPNVESISVMMFPDGRMDAKNAARYLGFKEKTLAMMRGNGTDPKFIKRGRIFYYREDLDHWMQEGRCVSTSQAQQR